MTFNDWVTMGMNYGYCSLPFCQTHDGLLTEEEIAAFDEGDDPCILVARVYPDACPIKGLEDQ